MAKDLTPTSGAGSNQLDVLRDDPQNDVKFVRKGGVEREHIKTPEGNVLSRETTVGGLLQTAVVYNGADSSSTDQDQAIRDLRVRQKKTQQEIADILGIDQSTVSRRLKALGIS
ncbi:helix-turn-helix domain-containing protein [Pararhodospirillum oryzae]|nr:helix-turn-helix domain-containing protein [Pararhodospirillum oryzae]